MNTSRADVQVVQTMVDTMVGTPRFSYPAKKNADRPEGAFAHIQLLEEYQVAIPTKLVTEADDNTTTYMTLSPARLRFRIGLVDTDGSQSSQIMHGWNSEPMKALMIQLGYGFVRCMPASLEDALLEKQWEERQGLSLELYTTRRYVEVVDNIRALQISGEFYTGHIDPILLTFDINE